MTGITSGKSYGVHLIFLPWTTSPDYFPEVTELNGGKYSFDLNVNGFSLYKRSVTGE